MLCINGPLIYEAKCLKTKVTDNGVMCYVHYPGWNTRWDEWIPEDHMLKVNRTNLKKQKELKDKLEAELRGQKKKRSRRRRTSQRRQYPDTQSSAASPPTVMKKKASAIKPSSSNDVAHSRREQFPLQVEMKINLPEDLRSLLLEDWNFICKKKNLMKLPAQVTVEKILKNFLKDETTSKKDFPYEQNTLIDFVNGFEELFNSFLGTQLLYNFERPQYDQILEKYTDTPMSKIYGASHLLRLFVRLSSIISRTPGDDDNIRDMLIHIHDLLRYLTRHMDKLFNLKDFGITVQDVRKRKGSLDAKK